MNSEETILGTLLAGEFEDSRPPNITRLLKDAPESFDDLRLGHIAWGIWNTAGEHGLVNPFAVTFCLDSHNKQIEESFVRQLTLNSLTPALCELEAETLWQKYRQRRIKATLSDAALAMDSKPDAIDDILAKLQWTIGRVEAEAGPSLCNLEFDPSHEPPLVRPIYTLNGQCIGTPGNIVTITSLPKTGKTAVITSMAGSAMKITHDGDCLGFGSSNPDGKALLYFDSEQSPDDFWHCVKRTLRRAGLDRPPKWFHAYCLTGLGPQKAWKFIRDKIQQSAEMHGGIHSILIDGAADTVNDVNDPRESQDRVAEFHALAIKHDCPLVGNLHFNPGTEKSRGHFGSQLERKSESNLRLDKTDSITTIWSDKQRRSPIPKEHGPCFQWSDEAGMHVSVASKAASKDELERERLKNTFADMFLDRPSMRYTDLKVTIKKTMRVSEPTAERKIDRAINLEVIKKTVGGHYTLTT